MKKNSLAILVLCSFGITIWSQYGSHNLPNAHQQIEKEKLQFVKKLRPLSSEPKTFVVEKAFARPPVLPSKSVPSSSTKTAVFFTPATAPRSGVTNLSKVPQNHLSKKERAISRAQEATDEPALDMAIKSPRKLLLKTHRMPTSSDLLPIELSPGVVAPLAFQPQKDELLPAQAVAQQQLAKAFIDELEVVDAQSHTINSSNTPAEPVSAPETLTDTYYEALQISNEQYRTLFGQEASNLAGIQAILGSL